MRKSFLIIFCSLSLSASSAFALSSEIECVNLWVMISNNTANKCTLQHSDLRHGYLRESTPIPKEIAAGHTSYPIELSQSTFYGPTLVLTYQCGEGKEISFESHQDVCFNSPGHITGTIYNAKNMSASFVSENGSMSANRFGTINWILTDN